MKKRYRTKLNDDDFVGLKTKKAMDVNHPNHGEYIAFKENKTYPFLIKRNNLIMSLDEQGEVHALNRTGPFTCEHFEEDENATFDELTRKRIQKLSDEAYNYNLSDDKE